ncbi:hypothetical protein [Tsukamurella paurometabola]|uniref:Uncharacterized protein n=1 Tax=Tsukamurella paurometabola TaxID=2061 RepID=A0ABS5NF09_TSUPA|nr:hypothetical protein [Tsukamurella paurometabola]MBS4102462.1 hypothetical protein [Tsukamurella paurometabola]
MSDLLDRLNDLYTTKRALACDMLGADQTQYFLGMENVLAAVAKLIEEEL